jgi:hypothetical protein
LDPAWLCLGILDLQVLFSVGKNVRLFGSCSVEGAYTNVQRASVAGSLGIACGLSMTNSAIFGPDLSISGDTISNGSLSVAISGRFSGDFSDAILMLDLVSLLQED